MIGATRQQEEPFMLATHRIPSPQFSLSLSLSIYIYIYICVCVCVCVCVVYNTMCYIYVVYLHELVLIQDDNNS
jgi:hypothetical protein